MSLRVHREAEAEYLEAALWYARRADLGAEFRSRQAIEGYSGDEGDIPAGTALRLFAAYRYGLVRRFVLTLFCRAR